MRKDPRKKFRSTFSFSNSTCQIDVKCAWVGAEMLRSPRCHMSSKYTSAPYILSAKPQSRVYSGLEGFAWKFAKWLQRHQVTCIGQEWHKNAPTFWATHTKLNATIFLEVNQVVQTVKPAGLVLVLRDQQNPDWGRSLFKSLLCMVIDKRKTV